MSLKKSVKLKLLEKILDQENFSWETHFSVKSTKNKLAHLLHHPWDIC